MNKLENLIDMSKLNDLLGKKDEEKKCNTVMCVLAVIGIIAAAAAIAYGIYRYFNPKFLDDFDDEFEDEFEDEEADDDDEEDFFVDEGDN